MPSSPRWDGEPPQSDHCRPCRCLLSSAGRHREGRRKLTWPPVVPIYVSGAGQSHAGHWITSVTSVHCPTPSGGNHVVKSVIHLLMPGAYRTTARKPFFPHRSNLVPDGHAVGFRNTWNLIHLETLLKLDFIRGILLSDAADNDTGHLSFRHPLPSLLAAFS